MSHTFFYFQTIHNDHVFAEAEEFFTLKFREVDAFYLHDFRVLRVSIMLYKVVVFSFSPIVGAVL